MKSQNQLGIYIRERQATVVCLASQGRDRKLLDCFSVSVEEPEESPLAVLMDRIAAECATRKTSFGEVAVALDCALFMQHDIRSQFTDHRQIAATVRSDAEEMLATDISQVATAFRVISSDANGSNLDVFTASRNVLADVILPLQGHGIDPVIIDPDVYCLSRYIVERGPSDGDSVGLLYGLLSDSRGYFVGVPKPGEVSLLRTFLIGRSQDREAVLARETLVTLGLTENTGSPEVVRVFDATGQSDAEQLGTRLGLAGETCDLPAMAGVEAQAVSGCSNPVDFALAYGAVLGLGDKQTTADFRQDHMPYEGKKARLQKAVRFSSFSLTILVLAAGLFFQTQLMKTNRYRAALYEKLEPGYLAVMLGQNEMPETTKETADSLERVLRIIRREKTGVYDRDSISGRLTLVFEAMNTCAKQIDLNIDSITITPSDILMSGDTRRRQDTVEVLFGAMEDAGLSVLNDSAETEGGRDSFTMTLQAKRQQREN